MHWSPDPEALRGRVAVVAAVSETPRFVGRAIVALASDPNRHRWHRQSVDAGALAREYGFTDVDGSQPDCWRYMEVTEAGAAVDPADFR